MGRCSMRAGGRPGRGRRALPPPATESRGSRSARRNPRPRRPAGVPVRPGHVLRPGEPFSPLVVWRLGTEPFLDGLRAVDGRALLAAAAIGLVTTVCCAWRWTIVARGLGVQLSLPTAVAAYYRSIFLNLTLPGGVAGDVHRGVSHGRDVQDVGRGLRIVAWERTAGQLVQAVLTIAVLLVLPSPLRPFMPLVIAALAATIVVIVLVEPGSLGEWALPVGASAERDGVGPPRRIAPPEGAAGGRTRLGRGRPRPCGHLPGRRADRRRHRAARRRCFRWCCSRCSPLCCRASPAGGRARARRRGCSPRPGLGAGRGAATTVAFGVMALVASLPGMLVLLAGWLPRPQRPFGRRALGPVRPEGAADA